MIKNYFAIASMMLLAHVSFSQCNELFISEYVEGSGNDKALEIYNPTAGSIDLNTYSIRRYSNGAQDYSAGGVTMLIGTLAALDVHVVTNGQLTSTPNSPSVNPELLLLADQPDGAYPAPTFMNGNDAIVLAKGDVIIDIFGKYGEDPGTAWTNEFPYSGTGTWITSNHTMIRKAVVQTGVTVNPDFFDPLAQYDTLPNNTWTNLGIHDCICNTINTIKEAEMTQIRVFPNPVMNNELNISSSKTILGMQIRNMIGQLVFSANNSNSNSKLMKVTVDRLPRGVYYLQVQNPYGSSAVQKIVIR